jgi:hypothetical protein
MTTADHGPFERQRQAADSVRHIYDAMHASTRRGVMAEEEYKLLNSACTEAGIELGAYDHRILTWLAGWEAETCAVVAGLITRASEARGAVQGPAELETVCQALADASAWWTWRTGGDRAAEHSTTRRIRAALSQTPSDLEEVPTNRSYIDIDMLGAGDPREADGWLRPDAQAALNTVPEEVIWLYKGLKRARNYLTHSSDESRDRLATAIRQISGDDPRFMLNQDLTRRVLIDWLRAKDAQRLCLLSSCVPTLWGAMVVAESILESSPQAETG